MKILNLLPVIDTGFWTNEMTNYISKYLLPGTQVDTWYLDRGPASIEGEYDECLAAAAVVLKCVEAEKPDMTLFSSIALATPARAPLVKLLKSRFLEGLSLLCSTRLAQATKYPL